MKTLKKISLILLMCFTLIFSLNSNIFAATIESMNPVYKITTANVNFRSIATTSSGVIKELSKGTKLKAVGSIDNFYIVQLSTNEVGLVYKDYVNSGSSAPSGASTYTNIGKTSGVINSDSVNFRRGPRHWF